MTRSAREEAIVYMWRDKALVEAPADSTSLAVADSFLVADGKAVAPERHRRRFLASCRDSGRDVSTVSEFWSAAMCALPREGHYFPRLELRLTGELAVLIRPAPRVTGEPIELAIYPAADPRTAPTVKGPDLPLLARLREDASTTADDVLLTDTGGRILETTTAAVVWWHGETLCAPDPDLRLLPSITCGIVLDTARRRGIPIRLCRAEVEDLTGAEVWSLNSLHGIRSVTAVTGDTPLTLAATISAAEWQDALWSLARPLR